MNFHSLLFVFLLQAPHPDTLLILWPWLIPSHSETALWQKPLQIMAYGRSHQTQCDFFFLFPFHPFSYFFSPRCVTFEHLLDLHLCVASIFRFMAWERRISAVLRDLHEKSSEAVDQIVSTF